MHDYVEGAGVALAYEQQGTVTPVLLVHDLAADRQGWGSLRTGLAQRARVIVYDRRGYGDSGAPEPYEGTTVYEQSEDAAALLGSLDASPALVCGAGLGALVALDLSIRHRELVLGAVLADPPLFAFAAGATEALSAERELLSQAARERGPQAAVALWLGAGASEPVLARARRAHGAFFADFAGLTSWPVTRAQLRGIDAPTMVLTGPETPAHVEQAAAALTDLLAVVQRRRDGDLMGAVTSLLR
jgi:pimeloyl-ACP methyl ester carboxylesterase